MKILVCFNEKGSAAVEFALCIPLLMLIFFGILEYGWYFTNQIVLSNAVSAGARAGIKAKEWDGEDPKIFAKNATRNAFWISNIPTVIVKDDIDDDASDPPRKITVTVSSLPYSPITGFLTSGVLIPDVVKAKAVMAFP